MHFGSQLVFCTLLQAVQSRHRPHAPVVQSPSGTYVGNTSISNLDQFLGIPYAEPPVGELRFAQPQPLSQKLASPFAATEYGPGCIQDPAFALYNGLSEDCLTLNIIRPRRSSKCKTLLPVLFWIHGGANLNGQSIFYNGTALVQYSASINEPVLYVGINYRLGGFGFLNSPDFQAAGLTNNGLRDQHLALEWVHQNIESFGGDPVKVTIFGESAGAWDCWSQLHRAYTQNETNKYFRGMITESGSPGSLVFPVEVSPEEALPAYQAILSNTSCSGAADSIVCLRDVPVDSLSPLLIYTADYSRDNDWFSADLVSLLTSYQLAPIPVIHGANLDEGSVFLPSIFPDSSIPSRDDLVELIAPYLNSSIQLAASIIEAYINGSISLTELGKGFDSDPTAPSSYWPAVAVYSDIYFHLGRRAFLRAASDRGIPIWGYHFDQTPPLSQLNLSYEYPGFNDSYIRRVGVQHGAELAYVFGEASNLPGRTEGDVMVSTTMMRAWIGFAYNLDPNVDGVPQWPRYERNSTTAGQTMFFAQQGDQIIEARPDTVRQTAYEKWNDAREALGLDVIY